MSFVCGLQVHSIFNWLQKWDECLCLQDSDGDGRTNGEELGDPDCNWTEDGDPVEVDNLGHPG